MAPELRDPIKAKDVARRLTLKAASRLRRMEYYAGAMSFSARLENDMRVHAEQRFYRAQDNKTFLDLLNRLWTQALKESPGVRIRKSLGHAFGPGRGHQSASGLIREPAGRRS